jgi:hypothetical protein
VVSSPYHTSCKIQPLDVYFLGPLKPAYNRECVLIKRIHLHEAIRIKDIPSLFNASYQKITAIAKYMSGFVKQSFTL